MITRSVRAPMALAIRNRRSWCEAPSMCSIIGLADWPSGSRYSVVDPIAIRSRRRLSGHAEADWVEGPAFSQCSWPTGWVSLHPLEPPAGEPADVHRHDPCWSGSGHRSADDRAARLPTRGHLRQVSCKRRRSGPDAWPRTRCAGVRYRGRFLMPLCFQVCTTRRTKGGCPLIGEIACSDSSV